MRWTGLLSSMHGMYLMYELVRQPALDELCCWLLILLVHPSLKQFCEACRGSWTLLLKFLRHVEPLAECLHSVHSQDHQARCVTTNNRHVLKARVHKVMGGATLSRTHLMLRPHKLMAIVLAKAILQPHVPHSAMDVRARSA